MVTMIVFKSHQNRIRNLRDPLSKSKWLLRIEDIELERNLDFIDEGIGYCEKNDVTRLKRRKPYKKVVIDDFRDIFDQISEILTPDKD